MKRDRLHVLGIRHHGPGSAASVVAALKQIGPAFVLIEGPSDANELIHFAGYAGMKPPLALLTYAQDDPAQSLFYPYAHYSPEWQAIQWALTNQREVRFIDLPASVKLASKLAQESRRLLENEEHENEEHEPEEQDPTIKVTPDLDDLLSDPLSALAAAAGESDGESWWNSLVEQSNNGIEVFDAIHDAMAAVRAEYESSITLEERAREAHMRLEIADALQQNTSGAVVVVCGAWHAPSLTIEQTKKHDKDLLKEFTATLVGVQIKLKTTATWVPWTDSRLAAASGYRAGVISPGWYRHLWSQYSAQQGSQSIEFVTGHWQAKVAHLMREEGIGASPASVIEAARLAMNLAAVRGFPMPGLEEMQDASLAALCHGDSLQLKLIERRLVIGDSIGEIDSQVPQMPLAQDLQTWQKKLRLKPSASPEEISLDLRSDAGLQKSSLFNRLLLINVGWAVLVDGQAGRGTFREAWRLEWAPELSVKLAEALRFGTTIEQAAANAAYEAAQKETSLSRCAELIRLCLHADLPAATEQLATRLQALSISSNDIEQLMRACVPLIQVLRYGTARQMPKQSLLALVHSLCAEINIGLVFACRGLNEEAVNILQDAMGHFDQALPLLEDPTHLQHWHKALRNLELDDGAAPFLRGFALRRIYDAQVIDADATAVRLSRALSAAVPPLEAGQWLEGFFRNAAQILINDQRLLGIVDTWMLGLDETVFVEMLPVFRRAVGSFDAMERHHLIEKVKEQGAKPFTVVSESTGSVSATLDATDSLAEQTFQQMLPLLKTMLGVAHD